MDNIAIFKDTMKYIRDNFKGEELKQILEVLSFSPDEVKKIVSIEKKIGNYNMELSVENTDTVSSALNNINSTDFDENTDKVLILNFANAFIPAPGVRFGSNAQEEDLCRKTTLFPSLISEKAKKMYKYNKIYCDNLASDYMILSPNVRILKNFNGDKLEKFEKVGVLTAAAPNISFLEDIDEEKLNRIFKQRIKAIYHIASYFGYNYLILGAWGCGVFGNDAKKISEIFKYELEEFEKTAKNNKNHFKKIEFAVLDRSIEKYNFNQFKKNILG